MTGGPLRRLQELAAEVRRRIACLSRATKEVNLAGGRQSAMDFGIGIACWWHARLPEMAR
jgi:hypothetical protein